MLDNAVLTQLTQQAESEGASLVTLRAMIEEASQLGAGRAMASLGLSDPRAGDDIGELRELLGAWRDAKRTARNEVIGWTVRVVLAVLVLGLAVRLGLVALVRA
jgi:hypothetical protein